MITRKNDLFIHYYIRNLNATESAKRAGYSPKTAYSMGQQLLKKVEVKQAVDAGIEKIKEEYNLTKDKYIQKTIDLFKDTQHPSVKQRYWELLGRVCGHYEENGVKLTQNIVSKEDIALLQRLYDKVTDVQLPDKQTSYSGS